MTDAAQATQTVRDQLTDPGWFIWGLHDRVMTAAHALTDPNLPASEANKVIDRLSANGELGDFAAQTLGRGLYSFGGAMSTSERQHFMADMAKKLDGKQLAELSNAFASTDANSGGHDYVQELGRAVATHASPQAKLDYIRELAPKTTDKPSYSTFGFANSATIRGDAEAGAVGDVLGSLTGARAHEGFAMLSSDQRKAVVEAAVGSRFQTIASTYGTANTLTYDTSRIGGLMNAAASTDDPKLKAEMFAAGADALRPVRDTGNILGGLTVIGKSAAEQAITNGMTRLIDSDTTGVVRSLAYGETTFDGRALSTYAKQMLNTGQEAKLGEMMAKLSKGNDLRGDPVARFEQPVAGPSGKPRSENAGAMGSFVGAVYKATESISSDEKVQQDMVTAVLKTALTVFDKTKTWGTLAGGVASVAKEWVSYGVKAALSDASSSPATRLERAAMPIDPKTRTVAVGDAATSQFGFKIGETGRMAKP